MASIYYFIYICYNANGEIMAQFFKQNTLDINEEKFVDYFNLNNLNNFEKLYIIEDINKIINLIKGKSITIIGFKDKELQKLLKSKGFSEINYIDDKVSNYISIRLIEQADLIFIKDNYEIISEYDLLNSLYNYKKIIISNNIEILKKLKLIKGDLTKTNIVIDKYGIINDI